MTWRHLGRIVRGQVWHIGSSLGQQRAQIGEQVWRRGPQLDAVLERKAAENVFASRRQTYQHAAAVNRVGRTLDETMSRHPVDQLDRAMVPNLEPLSNLADRCSVVHGEPLDRQQQLMLLRLEAGRASHFIAEMQEATDQQPEAGKRRVVNVVRRKGATVHKARLYRVTIENGRVAGPGKSRARGRTQADRPGGEPPERPEGL
jgi:hypothetical protein